MSLRVEVLLRVTGLDGAVYIEASETRVIPHSIENAATDEFVRTAKASAEIIERQRASFDAQIAAMMNLTDELD